MSEFRNVTVVKKANIYFDGGVVSRTVIFPDGSKKTLGVMQPGEYLFSTGVAEVMEILSGDLEYRIADGQWLPGHGGQSFEVPANSTFTVKVSSLCDYCCSFIS